MNSTQSTPTLSLEISFSVHTLSSCDYLLPSLLHWDSEYLSAFPFSFLIYPGAGVYIVVVILHISHRIICGLHYDAMVHVFEEEGILLHLKSDGFVICS